MNREQFIEEFKRRLEIESPHKDAFVELFIKTIEDLVEPTSNLDISLIEESSCLTNIALHWPGEIDEYWVALVVMTAKTFVRAAPKEAALLRKSR